MSAQLKHATSGFNVISLVAQDTDVLDYEYDSELDWEEADEGESCGSSAGDKDGDEQDEKDPDELVHF